MSSDTQQPRVLGEPPLMSNDPFDGPQGQTRTPIQELQRASACLYLALPESIADDVRNKVDAVVALAELLRREHEQMRQECDLYKHSRTRCACVLEEEECRQLRHVANMEALHLPLSDDKIRLIQEVQKLEEERDQLHEENSIHCAMIDQLRVQVAQMQAAIAKAAEEGLSNA